MPVFFWHPSWLKRADRFHTGVKKFIDTNRDLMPEDRLTAVVEGHRDYGQALKARDQARLEAMEGELTKLCEKSVPGYETSVFRENVEVIVVAVIVALGIRAYYLQPFKIPTASMQPTLNGITSAVLKDGESPPNILMRGFEFLWRGRNYTDLVIPESWGETKLLAYRQYSKANFFTFTELKFDNGQTLKRYAPARQLLGDTLVAWTPAERTQLNRIRADDTTGFVDLSSPLPVRGGMVVSRGYIDTGDQLLVDKFSYHFRRPARGEVFVFNTRDIKGIREEHERAAVQNQTPMMPVDASQHYIKRLTALPGDTIEIQSPDLYINGAPAVEEGTKRVMAMGPSNTGQNYGGYQQVTLSPLLPRDPVTGVAKLPDSPRMYMAMGDNSYHSSDSRYWGPVPERNLVGPALLVYWPFAPHWGFIR